MYTQYMCTHIHVCIHTYRRESGGSSSCYRRRSEPYVYSERDGGEGRGGWEREKARDRGVVPYPRDRPMYSAQQQLCGGEAGGGEGEEEEETEELEEEVLTTRWP